MSKFFPTDAVSEKETEQYLNRLAGLPELVKTTNEQAQLSEGKNLILCLGLTDAGKTTIVNALSGVPLRVTSEGKVQCVDSKDAIGKIGMTHLSETVHPCIVEWEKKGVALYDGPGVADNRLDTDSAKVFCSNLALPLTLHYAKGVRAILLHIDVRGLSVVKGKPFSDLLRSVIALFSDESIASIMRSYAYAGEEGKPSTFFDNIGFVFTHVQTETQQGILADLKQEQSKLVGEIDSLVKSSCKQFKGLLDHGFLPPSLSDKLSLIPNIETFKQVDDLLDVMRESAAVNESVFTKSTDAGGAFKKLYDGIDLSLRKKVERGRELFFLGLMLRSTDRFFCVTKDDLVNNGDSISLNRIKKYLNSLSGNMPHNTFIRNANYNPALSDWRKLINVCQLGGTKLVSHLVGDLLNEELAFRKHFFFIADSQLKYRSLIQELESLSTLSNQSLNSVFNRLTNLVVSITSQRNTRKEDWLNEKSVIQTKLDSLYDDTKEVPLEEQYSGIPSETDFSKPKSSVLWSWLSAGYRSLVIGGVALLGPYAVATAAVSLLAGVLPIDRIPWLTRLFSGIKKTSRVARRVVDWPALRFSRPKKEETFRYEGMPYTSVKMTPSIEYTDHSTRLRVIKRMVAGQYENFGRNPVFLDKDLGILYLTPQKFMSLYRVVTGQHPFVKPSEMKENEISFHAVVALDKDRYKKACEILGKDPDREDDRELINLWLGSGFGYIPDTLVDKPQDGKFKVTYLLRGKPKRNDLKVKIQLYVLQRNHPVKRAEIEALKKSLSVLEAHMSQRLHASANELSDAFQLAHDRLSQQKDLEVWRANLVAFLQEIISESDRDFLRCYETYRGLISDIRLHYVAYKRLRVMCQMLSEVACIFRATGEAVSFFNRYQNDPLLKVLKVLGRGPMDVWGYRQENPDGPKSQPKYILSGPKGSGSAIGARYLSPQDCRGWHFSPNSKDSKESPSLMRQYLGKYSFPNREVSQGKGSSQGEVDGTHIRRRMAADAVLEKLGEVFYRHFSEGVFEVARVRLAELPMSNKYTNKNPSKKGLQQALQRGKDKGSADLVVHVMSEFIPGYKDFYYLNCAMLILPEGKPIEGTQSTDACYVIRGDSFYYYCQSRGVVQHAIPLEAAVIQVLKEEFKGKKCLTASDLERIKELTGHCAEYDHCYVSHCQLHLGFTECLSRQLIPDWVYWQGKKLRLNGLEEMLAASVVLADVDVFGGSGKNAGIVPVRGAGSDDGSLKCGDFTGVTAVKIDTGEVFSFGPVNRRLVSDDMRRDELWMEDSRHIQYATMGDTNYIPWGNLSRDQKHKFLVALRDNLNFLDSDSGQTMIKKMSDSPDLRKTPSGRILYDFDAHGNPIYVSSDIALWGKYRAKIRKTYQQEFKSLPKNVGFFMLDTFVFRTKGVAGQLGDQVEFVVDGKPEVQFTLQPVPPDGDCGYKSFGVSREKAHELLESGVDSNAIVRSLVRDVFVSQVHLEARSDGGKTLSSFFLCPSLLLYMMSYGSSFRNGSKPPEISEELDTFLSDKGNLKSYLRLDVKQKLFERGWAHPSLLLALAHVCSVNLFIWRRSGKSARRLVQNGATTENHMAKPPGAVQTKHILYSRGSHFDFLKPVASTDIDGFGCS